LAARHVKGLLGRLGKNNCVLPLAAAIGTITAAAVVLGKRSIVDVPTLLLMLVTILLIWKAKKLPEPAIVAAAALVGLVIYPLLKT